MTVNNYYVYQHIDESGEIVYVGKGRYARAWRHERRNGEHSTWMAQRLPFLNVTITNFNLAEEEAFKIEKEMIDTVKPKFNVYMSEEDKAKRKEFGKWLSNTHSRFHDSALQTELAHRGAASPRHPSKVIDTCKHCGVQMLIGHIYRYHNDNCKKRVSPNETN
jgi:hypothetical protein